jgi:hypothetical protein
MSAHTFRQREAFAWVESWPFVVIANIAAWACVFGAAWNGSL